MPIDREMLTEEKGVSMKMSEEVEIKELTKGPAKHRTPWAPFISRLMFSDLKDTYQRFVVVSFQAFCLLLFITAQFYLKTSRFSAVNPPYAFKRIMVVGRNVLDFFRNSTCQLLIL